MNKKKKGTAEEKRRTSETSNNGTPTKTFTRESDDDPVASLWRTLSMSMGLLNKGTDGNTRTRVNNAKQGTDEKLTVWFHSGDPRSVFADFSYNIPFSTRAGSSAYKMISRRSTNPRGIGQGSCQ